MTDRSRGGPIPDTFTTFQVIVARAFIGLPESQGFLLAGGAALVALGLTHRPTHDLDFFTSRPAAVPAARDAFEAAAFARGWTVERMADTPTFCRLVVRGGGSVLVDLAGRKLLALFDRAEARDFADVYALAQLLGRQAVLETAAGLDAGLAPASLADQMALLSRYDDADLPIDRDQVTELRSFFARWIMELQP